MLQSSFWYTCFFLTKSVWCCVGFLTLSYLSNGWQWSTCASHCQTYTWTRCCTSSHLPWRAPPTWSSTCIGATNCSCCMAPNWSSALLASWPHWGHCRGCSAIAIKTLPKCQSPTFHNVASLHVEYRLILPSWWRHTHWFTMYFKRKRYS